MSHHEEREGQEGKEFEELSRRVIGCAIEVHRFLGPGLLESSYQTCLGRELDRFANASAKRGNPRGVARARKLRVLSGAIGAGRFSGARRSNALKIKGGGA